MCMRVATCAGATAGPSPPRHVGRCGDGRDPSRDAPQACLLDDERRAIYDETGIIDEEDGFDAAQFEGEPFAELLAYFQEAARSVAPDEVITHELEVEYRGSSDEVADLVAFYQQFGGRMEGIAEFIPFADESDLCRFRGILDDEIGGGRLQPTKAYRAFDPPEGPSTAKVVARAKAKLAAAKRARASALKAAEAAEGPPADVFALIQEKDRLHLRDRSAIIGANNTNANNADMADGKNAKKDRAPGKGGLNGKKSKAKAAAT